jgi:hypothetical protein
MEWLMEGKETFEKIIDAVIEILRLETWLASNQKQFIEFSRFALKPANLKA